MGTPRFQGDSAPKSRMLRVKLTAPYLLDVNANGLGNCGINAPVLLNPKVPRALDWNQ